jgi:EF hand domain-containing protein
MRFPIRTPFMLASVCSLALAGPALAGGGKGHHAGPGAFRMMDANNDGKISAAEHEAGAKKMFETMDTSKDGKVTAEEMEAAQDHMMGKPMGDKAGMGAADKGAGDKTVPSTAEKPVTEKGPMDKQMAGHHMMSASEKIKVVDSNGDGVLTAQEHEAASKAMFEKMDTNKDGNLTKAEMMSGHEKMMSKPAK